jgi:hypothetical protein
MGSWLARPAQVLEKGEGNHIVSRPLVNCIF